MTAALDPEAVHPSLWRASQLARSHTQCIDTGFSSLSMQLPGGGWPKGALVDVLLQQPGIGELRLLAPALSKVAARQIAFLQPPHPPQALALAAMGIPPSALWLRADRTPDMLWAAEQVLRSGSCGALLFWQPQIRSDSLRRLHLAAQAGETLFFMMRPMYSAQDASPAPLRLGLRPKAGGIEIDFIKRRGPQRDAPLFLPMSITTTRAQPQRHTVPAEHAGASAEASARVLQA
jgi:protein ImuA